MNDIKDTSMTDQQKLEISSLKHTWLIDIDGTIAIHNGYFRSEKDIPIKESINFLHSLPKEDYVVLLTSREEKYRTLTEQFLEDNGIKYDAILFNLPVGERILINDDKPSGLCMSHAVRVKRNKGIQLAITVNKDV